MGPPCIYSNTKIKPCLLKARERNPDKKSVVYAEKKEVCRTIFGSAALAEPFKSSA
jgi:hypothetical protein